MLGKKSPQNGRENADDVILLFTDGKPNAENTTQEIIDADKYSKILKNEKNVKIIGVAAGDISLHRKHIQGWADSLDMVYETRLATLAMEDSVNTLVEQLKHPLFGKYNRRRDTR